MRRAHRAVHCVLWPALAIAVALLFASALILRPPPDDDTAAEQSESLP